MARSTKPPVRSPATPMAATATMATESTGTAHRRAAPCRTGFSSSTKVPHASATLAATSAVRTAVGGVSAYAMRANESSGQCHR